MMFFYDLEIFLGNYLVLVVEEGGVLGCRRFFYIF